MERVRVVLAGLPRMLTEIVQRARVRLFELARPSLHDIFIRIAGPEAEAAEKEEAARV